MNIKTTKVDGVADGELRKVIGIIQNVESDTAEIKAAVVPDPNKWKSAFIAAGAAKSGSYAVDAFKAVNSFGRDEYIKKLGEIGAPPEAAPAIADEIMQFAKSDPVRPFLVGVSAATGAYAILEAASVASPRVRSLSTGTKLATSIAIGVIIAISYYVLQQNGYISK